MYLFYLFFTLQLQLHATDAMLLAEDLKDKKSEARASENVIQERKHPAGAEWQEAKLADQMLQICQSKQLSFQQPQHLTSRQLIIDRIRLCCFLILSLSMSVYLSVSPCLHPFSLPKIRHRLQHESCRPVFGSVTSDFAAGAVHFPQLCVAMAPARSPQGPSYLHSSACSTSVSILSSPASCQRKAGVRPLAV